MLRDISARLAACLCHAWIARAGGRVRVLRKIFTDTMQFASVRHAPDQSLAGNRDMLTDILGFTPSAAAKTAFQ